MDSYGNGSKITGFLWIPIEKPRNSGTMSDGPKPQNHPTLQPTASIPQLPLKLAVLPPSTVPIGRFPPPSTAQPTPLSVLPHPLYFLSIKSRKGEEVWRRGGSRNIPESLKMLRKTKVSRQPEDRKAPTSHLRVTRPSPFLNFTVENCL